MYEMRLSKYILGLTIVKVLDDDFFFFIFINLETQLKLFKFIIEFFFFPLTILFIMEETTSKLEFDPKNLKSD